MSDLRATLERAADRFPEVPVELEGVLRRRDRRRRNNRIAAAALGIAIGIAAIVVGTNVVHMDRTKPANIVHTIDVSRWVQVRLPPGVGKGGLQAVTPIDDGFAAVSFDSIWLSADGLNWTAEPLQGPCRRNADPREMRRGTEGFDSPSSAYREIAALDSGLVAVGEAARTAGVRTDELGCWSADGRSWTPIEVELPPSTAAAFMDRIVTIDGKTFGLGGKGRRGNSRDALIWTTTDGRAWRLLSDESVFGGPMEQELTDVVPGGRGFVAKGFESKGPFLGSDSLVWTSADGMTWSRFQVRREEARAVLGPIAAGRDGLVGMGNGKIWTSDDGITWTPQLPNQMEGSGLFIVRNGSEYLAGTRRSWASFDPAGVTLYRSVDGMRWELVHRLDHTPGPRPTGGGFEPAWGATPARQVAVGSERIVIASASYSRDAKYVWVTVPPKDRS